MMSLKSLLLLISLLLFSGILCAQDYDKMNKSELRESLVKMQRSLDSIQVEERKLIQKANQNKLKCDSVAAELKKCDVAKFSSRAENSALQGQLSKSKEDLESVSSRYQQKQLEAANVEAQLKSRLSELNAIISSQRDSLTKILSAERILDGNGNSIVKSNSQSDDFLNNYFINQQSLNNDSFELQLSHVIYGNSSIQNVKDYSWVKYVDFDEYDDEDYGESSDIKGGVTAIPEILEAVDFNFWSVKKGVNLKYRTGIYDYLVKQDVNYFNAALPKIEVLKNKLFTLKYADGNEESFLFNAVFTLDQNNYRNVLQFELANEEVKNDGSNSTAKDMVWPIYVVGEECYVVLNSVQLYRMGLKLFYGTYGLDVGHTMLNNDYESDYSSGSLNLVTTGNGIYLTRKEDRFMNGEDFVHPGEVVFLFKLKRSN